MSKRLQSFYVLLSWSWLLLMLTFEAYDINALLTQKKVQFDLMALLPENKTEKMKVATQLMEHSNFMDRSLILIGHSNPIIARAALDKVRQLSLPLKEQKAAVVAEEYKIFFQKLYPYRAGLLAESDRDHLLKGNGEVLVQRALSNIMLPFNVLGPFQPNKDPFFLYPHFIASLQSSFSIEKDDKDEAFIQNDGKVWYLFKAQLTEPAFFFKTQKEMTEKLLPFLDHLQQTHGVDILKTGAVFYAAAGAAQANKEISQIGLFSILGIILILFFVFRTIKPLIFAFLVVSSGLVGGLAACLFIFNSVHILALVFGCSLVGVTVDYALHYFCASYQHDTSSPQNRFHVLKRLMPALPLGVFSSILGYALLMVAPFPGIQQMAVLASGGLLCSFLTVCFLGPFFVGYRGKSVPPLGVKLQGYLEQLADLGQWKKGQCILSILCVSLFLTGASVLTFEDDIRRFQSLDTRLKSEEERIQSMMKVDHGSRFLTIVGPTLEDVLQIEESLGVKLEDLKKNNNISSYRSLATLIPSKKRQEENRHLVEKGLYEKHSSSFAQSLGVELLMNVKDLGLKEPFLDEMGDLPEGWKELIHFSPEGRVMGQVLLQGVNALQALQELALKQEGVAYIDLPHEYSSLFAAYRQIMMGLVLAVLFGIMVVLSLWKGMKESVKIVSPVVLSILATIGIISLSGISINLFHTMGLLLILCIGIDYALFLYCRSNQKRDFLLLANGVSALTTILSFGFLSFSQTLAIHSFGLTVFIGIVLCFCLTTVFFGKGKSENE
jgi:predicted exporter